MTTHHERRLARAEFVKFVEETGDFQEALRKFQYAPSYARMLLQPGLQMRTTKPRSRSQSVLTIIGVLQNEPDVSLTDIGKRFGITRQAVCAISKDAVAAGIKIKPRPRGKKGEK